MHCWAMMQRAAIAVINSRLLAIYYTTATSPDSTACHRAMTSTAGRSSKNTLLEEGRHRVKVYKYILSRGGTCVVGVRQTLVFHRQTDGHGHMVDW